MYSQAGFAHQRLGRFQARVGFLMLTRIHGQGAQYRQQRLLAHRIAVVQIDAFQFGSDRRRNRVLVMYAHVLLITDAELHRTFRYRRQFDLNRLRREQTPR